MAKMTKAQLIDAIAEGTQLAKNDVKSVIEYMATVGYKELNEGQDVEFEVTTGPKGEQAANVRKV